MANAATFLVPEPKWRRVNHAYAQNRAANGTTEVVTGRAFYFNSLSYRTAYVRFDEKIDRVVIKFRNSNFPDAVYVSGLVSSGDLRNESSPFIVNVNGVTGRVNFGSGGTSSGTFYFDDVYGEVLG